MIENQESVERILDVDAYLTRLTGIQGWEAYGITMRWSPEQGGRTTQDFTFPLYDGESMRAMFTVTGEPGHASAFEVYVTRFDREGVDIGEKNETAYGQIDLAELEGEGPDMRDLLVGIYARTPELAM